MRCNFSSNHHQQSELSSGRIAPLSCVHQSALPVAGERQLHSEWQNPSSSELSSCFRSIALSKMGPAFMLTFFALACLVVSFIKGAPLVRSEALAIGKDSRTHDHEVKTIVKCNPWDSSLRSKYYSQTSWINFNDLISWYQIYNIFTCCLHSAFKESIIVYIVILTRSCLETIEHQLWKNLPAVRQKVYRQIWSKRQHYRVVVNLIEFRHALFSSLDFNFPS